MDTNKIKDLLSKPHFDISEISAKNLLLEEEYNSIQKGVLLEIDTNQDPDQFFEVLEKQYIPEANLCISMFEKEINKIWMCFFKRIHNIEKSNEIFIKISTMSKTAWEYMLDNKAKIKGYAKLSHYSDISSNLRNLSKRCNELSERFNTYLEIIRDITSKQEENITPEHIIKMLSAYANIIDEYTLDTFTQEELQLYIDASTQLLRLFKENYQFFIDNEEYGSKEELTKKAIKLSTTLQQVNIFQKGGVKYDH